jgi:type I restriction enzyme M protein
MAEMTKQIDGMNQLTNNQKADLKEEIRNNHLYGVDSTSKIARISRLNMYLHGDGGSKIFKANSLDKEMLIDPGMNKEDRDGIEELKKHVYEMKFDIVLTNPPFSIAYKSSDQNEKRILEQYKISKTGSGVLSSSEKSNVLFVERYLDLLRDSTGHLLTIIDDTVLNGENSQKYRDFILNNFVIIQIVSLPFNAFFRADANIKTSMMHLRKKAPGESQGDIFMAITNNIGHDDHQRDTPARNNIQTLLQYFQEWQKTGKRFSKIIHNQHPDEPLGCPLQVFTVTPSELNKERLDAFYYSPELKEAKNKIQKLCEEGRINIRTGSSFNVIEPIKKKDSINYEGKIFKYFEIGDVTIDGTIVKHIEDYFERLPTRGRLQVQTDDVIFAKNNSSRGTTVLIPEWFSGNLVTTGFIGIRPKDYEEALILWSAMESELFRKQVYYLSITASQPEVRENIFRTEMLVPWPRTESQAKRIIEKVKLVDQARNDLQKALRQTKETIQSTLSI